MPKATQKSSPPKQVRKHLVLVPGFVGFDVLGQIPYYAGVTSLFAEWRSAAPERAGSSVSYFDNFPTASVALRATRLRKFLAKKIARGDFAPGDELTLVGHSTGALDIRRLLVDLRKQPLAATYVDGAEPVRNSLIRHHVRRIVFLSAPQYGSNIADFAQRYANTIQNFAGDLITALGYSRQLVYRPLVRGFREAFARSNSQFFWALADLMDETDGRGPVEGEADEREARFLLGAWLEHIQHDTQALSDLRSATGAQEKSDSPAHYDAGARAKELLDFARSEAPIHTLSYATYARKVPASNVLERGIGGLRSMFIHGFNRLAPPIDIFSKLTKLFPQRARVSADLLGILAALGVLHGAPEELFNSAHTICADPRGPFLRAESLALARATKGLWPALLASYGLQTSDNDGVVNTLSMFWPFDADAPDPNHRLHVVRADHADIVGHFHSRLVHAPKSARRQRYAYDLFQSDSKFGTSEFKAVWDDVFAFAFASP